MRPERDLFIGLMSGTSMDAVDAVLADFSTGVKQLAHHSLTVPDSLREALLRLAANQSPHPLQCLGELDRLLADLFSQCTLELLDKTGIRASEVTAIGSHGQTLYHHPEGPTPFTLQIGDGNRIAQLTDITTVADFRRRDMAVGGQGAPLVPAFHQAVFSNTETNRIILNVGGMANITTLPVGDRQQVGGFDTGPGNVLMDGWIQRQSGQAYDRDGALARSGKVIDSLLGQLLADPFFHRAPPKSTGREHFNLAWLERFIQPQHRPEDVQASLCELTACSISDAVNQFSGVRSGELIVCGGGAHNRFLLERLAVHLPGFAVNSSKAYDIEPQQVEALAFAWLARQTLLGRPGNVPSVTGASKAVVLGAIYPRTP